MGDEELNLPLEDGENEDIKFVDNVVNETIDVATIFPFLDRKEITITKRKNQDVDGLISLSLYKLITDDDGERKRELIDDVEIPIGATKEYLKSILGDGKYLVILKNKYDGKFLTSKVLEFEDENVLNKGGKMLYQDDTGKTFLEREYQNLKIEVEALRKEKERLTEELLTLKTENMKLASERDNAIRNMSIANADMENKNKKIKELEEELKNAQKELKELEKKFDDTKQVIRDYETDKKITAREIQELKEDVNELKTEKTRLETELSNARSMKEIMSLIKKDDKNDIVPVLLTSLITHNTEKAKGEIELKKEQLNALKELKLAEIETGLRSAIEEEMPEEEEKIEENEKKNDLVSTLLQTLGTSIISPVADYLRKLGYTITKEEDVEKALKEREELARLDERKRLQGKMEEVKKEVSNVVNSEEKPKTTKKKEHVD